VRSIPMAWDASVLFEKAAMQNVKTRIILAISLPLELKRVFIAMVFKIGFGLCFSWEKDVNLTKKYLATKW